MHEIRLALAVAVAFLLKYIHYLKNRLFIRLNMFRLLLIVTRAYLFQQNFVIRSVNFLYCSFSELLRVAGGGGWGAILLLASGPTG